MRKTLESAIANSLRLLTDKQLELLMDAINGFEAANSVWEWRERTDPEGVLGLCEDDARIVWTAQGIETAIARVRENHGYNAVITPFGEILYEHQFNGKSPLDEFIFCGQSPQDAEEDLPF